MGVRVTAGDDEWELGTADFVHAFFSTVAARLEPRGWGMRFQALMNDLYAGRVGEAAGELSDIRVAFGDRPPGDVVWSFEDRSARPPWGDDISPETTTLADYFVTSDGRDLFDVLGEAFAAAAETGTDVRIG
jgi:hypothetical protein